MISQSVLDGVVHFILIDEQREEREHIDTILLADFIRIEVVSVNELENGRTSFECNIGGDMRILNYIDLVESIEEMIMSNKSVAMIQLLSPNPSREELKKAFRVIDVCQRINEMKSKGESVIKAIFFL